MLCFLVLFVCSTACDPRRNGTLRKKYDAIKWNLKKMETILYELSLTSAGKITQG